MNFHFLQILSRDLAGYLEGGQSDAAGVRVLWDGLRVCWCDIDVLSDGPVQAGSVCISEQISWKIPQELMIVAIEARFEPSLSALWSVAFGLGLECGAGLRFELSLSALWSVADRLHVEISDPSERRSMQTQEDLNVFLGGKCSSDSKISAIHNF